MSEQHWTQNLEVWQRVRDGLASFIYGEPAVKGGVFDEGEYKEILAIFNAEHPPMGFTSPGDYSNSFKGWFSANGYIYHNLKRGGNVGVSRQFPLPDGGTITLSIGGTFSLGNEAALSRTVDGLINGLEAEYHRIMAKNYGGLQQHQKGDKPGMLTPAPRQLRQNEITVQIDHIDTLYAGSRKMVRAFGGEFMRYGIPIYNEVLKPMGLDESTMEIGKKIPINRLAIVLMNKEGKPTKVTGWWDK